MSLGDSFMRMIGIESDEDMENISEEEIKKEKDRIAKQKKKAMDSAPAPAPAPAPTPAPAPAPAPAPTPAPATMSSTISKPQNYGRPERRFTVNSTSTSTSQFKLVLIEPKTFDECPKLVDSLKSKKPVIINLERLDTEVAKKIFDFLSGATYALDGNVQKVANNIFIFAPANVDIAGGIQEEEVEMPETGFTFNRDEPTLTADNPWGVR